MMKRTFMVPPSALATAAIFVAFSAGLVAQEYPTRPIHLVVAHAPGAATGVVSTLNAGLLNVLKDPAVRDSHHPYGI